MAGPGAGKGNSTLPGADPPSICGWRCPRHGGAPTGAGHSVKLPPLLQQSFREIGPGWSWRRPHSTTSPLTPSVPIYQVSENSSDISPIGSCATEHKPPEPMVARLPPPPQSSREGTSLWVSPPNGLRSVAPWAPSLSRPSPWRVTAARSLQERRPLSGPPSRLLSRADAALLGGEYCCVLPLELPQQPASPSPKVRPLRG